MHLIDVPVEATFGLRRGALGWTVPSATRIHGDDAAHLALLHGNAIAAVVFHAAWPCPDEPQVPARYFFGMAVDASYRGQGYGRRLLAAVADRARAAGESVVWAEARESAVGFYVACGARTGAPFVEDVVGLTVRRVVFTL
ncbi:GNAT family N-acetyltransferase [Micromonospora sp. NPDC050200]|uniref:GNAT family N-acetyltransferase n=1 Tax=Micromonospora sp. NPDC050200 TaxID=3155664 RepID=UPI0033E308B2